MEKEVNIWDWLESYDAQRRLLGDAGQRSGVEVGSEYPQSLSGHPDAWNGYGSKEAWQAARAKAIRENAAIRESRAVPNLLRGMFWAFVTVAVIAGAIWALTH